MSIEIAPVEMKSEELERRFDSASKEEADETKELRFFDANGTQLGSCRVLVYATDCEPLRDEEGHRVLLSLGSAAASIVGDLLLPDSNVDAVQLDSEYLVCAFRPKDISRVSVSPDGIKAFSVTVDISRARLGRTDGPSPLT